MNAPTSIEAKPDLKKVPELTLHQLCEIIPPCTEAEFKELKEDIKTNGLQVPIKTFEAKILDGRSRHKACVELEREGHPVEFKRESFLGSAKDALACVISMNVKRRHLSASQRALIVARLVTSKLGGDRSVKLPTEITQEDVARLAGVAVKTVTDAKKVMGHPDLVEKVLNGKLAVAKAADQVREEEEQANGESGKEGGAQGDQDDSEKKVDALVAACTKRRELLIEALEELRKASSFAIAKQNAEQAKDRIDVAIGQMRDADKEEKSKRDAA
jgi:ParB-like nuclease family protein